MAIMAPSRSMMANASTASGIAKKKFVKGTGKDSAQSQDRTRGGNENVGGIPGKESHGGDVAPPNADDAGRRQSPESGPPDKH